MVMSPEALVRMKFFLLFFRGKMQELVKGMDFALRRRFEAWLFHLPAG